MPAQQLRFYNSSIKPKGENDILTFLDYARVFGYRFLAPSKSLGKSTYYVQLTIKLLNLGQYSSFFIHFVFLLQPFSF